MRKTATKPAEPIDITNMIATEAREAVQTVIQAGQSIYCPCCDQHVYANSRRITATMARQLTHLMDGPLDSKSLQTSTHGGERQYSLLRHWGLIEKMADSDTWRITQRGREFRLGLITVPKYAYVYNNTCRGVSDEQVTFAQASKTPFVMEEVFETEEHLQGATLAPLGATP